jgi:hypothetical protein
VRYLATIVSATAFLIFSGGIPYTIGAIFNAWRRLRFQNAIWHAFVLVAAGCHYAAVLRAVRVGLRALQRAVLEPYNASELVQTRIPRMKWHPASSTRKFRSLNQVLMLDQVAES